MVRSSELRQWLVALLVCLIPVAAVAAEDPERPVVSLWTQSGAHALRSIRDGGHLYVNLADLAAAVGAAWGRDPASREPLFSRGQDRVMFSSRDRRITVNGRRRKLSRAVEFRTDGIYVPEDFVSDVLADLVGEDLDLSNGMPPRRQAAAPPPAPGEDGAVPGRLPVAPRAAQGDVRTIVLDPGHGGEEEGGRGPSGLLEKDVTLEVAQLLKRRLEADGYSVILTRDRDRDLPLEERTALANNARADLFISVHVNASPSAVASGVETYFLSLDRATQEGDRRGAHEAGLLNADSSDPLRLILWDMAQSAWMAESGALAEIIQAEFNASLELPDRGVKQAPLRVLVGATMPAVLIEIGFISNPDEEQALQDPVFLQRLVDSLGRSIATYGDRVQRQGEGGWERGWGSR